MFLPAFFSGSYLSWMIRQDSSYPCTADKILSREKKKESCLKGKTKKNLFRITRYSISLERQAWFFPQKRKKILARSSSWTSRAVFVHERLYIRASLRHLFIWIRRQRTVSASNMTKILSPFFCRSPMLVAGKSIYSMESVSFKTKPARNLFLDHTDCNDWQHQSRIEEATKVSIRQTRTIWSSSWKFVI